jgi:Tfp pilus assembly protein PilZ
MADKRSTKRRIKRMHIIFSCEGKEFRGISSNVSSTGIFIKTRKKFKTGLYVNMIVDIDENQKMNLNGVIARTKITSKFDRFVNGIGIELTEVPQAYKAFMEVLFKEQP